MRVKSNRKKKLFTSGCKLLVLSFQSNLRVRKTWGDSIQVNTLPLKYLAIFSQYLKVPLMNNSVSRSIEIIERTPTTLLALLQGLDDFWTLNNYGESSFSPFDVVGHLIQADRTNWIPRLRVILEHRNSQPFPGFDRYRMYEDSKGKSMTELLNAFGEIRRLSIDTLKELNLDEEQLKYAGLHPQMGEVTLSQLIAAWVVHDLGHIHQIAKSMAYQYRNEVGPWKEYLTILPR